MVYTVSNPVNYYSGGDTVSQAFGKHIAEFSRVYEILNTLGSSGATLVTSVDQVLKPREIGFHRDTGTMKVGDGVTPWSGLQGIAVIDLVNDLLSDDATKALSASQGKVLKSLIDAIPQVQVVDNLMDTSVDKALSAAQGKALKTMIDAVPVVDVVDNLTAGGGNKALSAEQGKVLKGLVDNVQPMPGPPGPPGIVWRGAWVASVDYQSNDVVSHLGSAYIAKKPSMGKVPPVAEFWDLLSAKGEDGVGAGDMLKTRYDANDDGKVSLADYADTAGSANTAGAAITAVTADMANSVAWDNVTGKPSNFGPEIIDALSSTSAVAGLSARQGRKLKLELDDKALKVHTHVIADVEGLGAQLSTSGGGITVLDLSGDLNFGTLALQVDSTAPMIAIPELGIFRYDPASTEVIDGETCLATKSGIGRYLLLVPDASWLFMVAVRDARKWLERLKFTTINSEEHTLTWTAISGNNGIQEQTIEVLGASPSGIVLVTPPPGFLPGLFYDVRCDAVNYVTIRCINRTTSVITPASGIWTINIAKEVI